MAELADEVMCGRSSRLQSMLEDLEVDVVKFATAEGVRAAVAALIEAHCALAGECVTVSRINLFGLKPAPLQGPGYTGSLQDCVITSHDLQQLATNPWFTPGRALLQLAVAVDTTPSLGGAMVSLQACRVHKAYLCTAPSCGAEYVSAEALADHLLVCSSAAGMGVREVLLLPRIAVYRCPRADLVIAVRGLGSHTLGVGLSSTSLYDMSGSVVNLWWDLFHLVFPSLLPAGSGPLPLPPEFEDAFFPTYYTFPFAELFQDPQLLFDDTVLRTTLVSAAKRLQQGGRIRVAAWRPLTTEDTDTPFDVGRVNVGPRHRLLEPLQAYQGDSAAAVARRAALITAGSWVVSFTARGHRTLKPGRGLAYVHACDVGGRRVFRLAGLHLGVPGQVRADDVWPIQECLNMLNRMAHTFVYAHEHGAKGPVWYRTRQLFNNARAAALSLQRRVIVRALRAVGLVVWDTSQLSRQSAWLHTEDKRRYDHLLVTARPSVLERRAEQLGLRVLVEPNPKTGRFAGGFVPSNFLRGAPFQRFWRKTMHSRYLYFPFFRPFSPVQRERLLLDLISEPYKPERPWEGGAGIILPELQAENIVLDAFPLHQPDVTAVLQREWVKLPAASRWRRFAAKARSGLQPSVSFTMLQLSPVAEAAGDAVADTTPGAEKAFDVGSGAAAGGGGGGGGGGEAKASPPPLAPAIQVGAHAVFRFPSANLLAAPAAAEFVPELSSPSANGSPGALAAASTRPTSDIAGAGVGAGAGAGAGRAAASVPDALQRRLPQSPLAPRGPTRLSPVQESTTSSGGNRSSPSRSRSPPHGRFRPPPLQNVTTPAEPEPTPRPGAGAACLRRASSSETGSAVAQQHVLMQQSAGTDDAMDSVLADEATLNSSAVVAGDVALSVQPSAPTPHVQQPLDRLSRGRRGEELLDTDDEEEGEEEELVEVGVSQQQLLPGDGRDDATATPPGRDVQPHVSSRQDSPAQRYAPSGRALAVSAASADEVEAVHADTVTGTPAGTPAAPPTAGASTAAAAAVAVAAPRRWSRGAGSMKPVVAAPRKRKRHGCCGSGPTCCCGCRRWTSCRAGGLLYGMGRGFLSFSRSLFSSNVETDPLHMVHDTFGSAWSFYFLFITVYAQALVWPSIVGVVVSVAWLFVGFRNTDDELDWFFYLRVGNAVFMMLWATLFLEGLTRKVRLYSHLWGASAATVDTHIRPAFIAAMEKRSRGDANNRRQVTVLETLLGIDELPANSPTRAARQKDLARDLTQFNELFYLPRTARTLRYLQSALFVLASCGVVAMSVVVVLVYPRRWIADEFKADLVAGVANGVLIPTLNYGYRLLAVWMTSRELHRFEHNHQNSLTIKLFAFFAVNSNLSLLVLAFIDRDAPRLRTHLLGILFTGQIISTVVQHGIVAAYDRIRYTSAFSAATTLMGWLQSVGRSHRAGQVHEIQRAGTVRVIADGSMKPTAGLDRQPSARSTDTHRTSRPVTTELYDPSLVEMTREALGQHTMQVLEPLAIEYLELVIQFGLVSACTFSTLLENCDGTVAFPPAAITALLNNMLELRLDARKLLLSRKDFSIHTNGIGVWFPILQLLSVFCVITNVAFVVIMTLDENTNKSLLSGTLPDTVDDQTSIVWVIIAIEHALILLKLLLRVLVPATPTRVKDDEFRQRYYTLKAETTLKDLDGFTNTTNDDDDDGDDAASDTNRSDDGVSRMSPASSWREEFEPDDPFAPRASFAVSRRRSRKRSRSHQPKL